MEQQSPLDLAKVRVTTRNILDCTVEDVAEAISRYFDADVPTPLVMADWSKARSSMAYYSNTFSTLCGYMSVLNVAIRRVKKSDPIYIEHAAKRDIVSEAKEAIGHKYEALSRQFTVYDVERKVSNGN
jgi:hypothetical protein